MGVDLGGAVDKILTAGLDIWVDTEKARNYKPGAQTVGQRDASGGTIPAGQPASVMPAWASSPAVQWGLAAVAVVVVIVLIKKL